MVTVTIDGQEFQTEKEKTILDVARGHSIRIPSLCYHPALKPSGSCKLCSVEVTGKSGGRPTIMQSCILRVKDGLEVNTQSERVG